MGRDCICPLHTWAPKDVGNTEATDAVSSVVDLSANYLDLYSNVLVVEGEVVEEGSP